MTWETDFILWLQSLGGEGTLLYYIFFFFTFLGEGIFIYGIICIVYWGISKNTAKRIAIPLTFSICFNELTKNIIRRQRPWMINSNIAAFQTTGGYSYPSGHTQSGIVFYFSASYHIKNKKLSLVAVFLCTLIALSRLYLGAHFPTDVLGGLVFGLLITVLYPIIERRFSRKTIFIFELILFVPLLFSAFFDKGFLSGVSDYYFKAVGILVGFVCGVITEEKIIGFHDAESLPERIIRCFVGFISSAFIFLILKYLFMFFSVNSTLSMLFVFLRYAILMFFAIAIYPMGFPFLHRISAKFKKKA